MDKPKYLEEFNEFIELYKIGTTTGEDVGLVIVKQTQHFAEANLSASKWSEIVNKKYAETINSTDGETSKPMSAAKAKILIESTDEYQELQKKKVNLENIDQIINSLKYLQKGALNEYSHMGNT
jgi:predicted DNA-binding protein (UPF0278 family)